MTVLYIASIYNYDQLNLIIFILYFNTLFPNQSGANNCTASNVLFVLHFMLISTKIRISKTCVLHIDLYRAVLIFGAAQAETKNRLKCKQQFFRRNAGRPICCQPQLWFTTFQIRITQVLESKTMLHTFFSKLFMYIFIQSLEATESDWSKTMSVNVAGYSFMAQACFHQVMILPKNLNH